MMNAYQRWWDTEGSAMRPHDHEDLEEFARRITEIAWNNGRFVEKEACALVRERSVTAPAGTYQILMAAAAAIRKGE
jgi:hypothetical protein